MRANPKEIPKGEVRTAHTVFDITEHLLAAEEASITDIAEELGYAKSTIHRHVSTLESLGYVVPVGGQYRLSLEFLRYGHHVRHQRTGYESAKEKVEQLAEETGERVQFIVEEAGKAVYLHRALGEQAVRTDPGIGHRIPLHATAAGKAILAAMSEAKCSEIIEQTDFTPITEKTVTTADELLEEIEAIRERQYSYNLQENLEGLRAVGVAVNGPADSVLGALSISGPTHRMQGERFEEELPNLLLGAANELELNIIYS